VVTPLTTGSSASTSERMSQASQLLWYILWVSVIGVSAVLIAVIVARLLAKRLGRQTRTQAFTIQDLRQMRSRGEITEQEYQAMRTTVIEHAVADSATSASTRPDAPSPPGSETEDHADDTPADPAPNDGTPT
jgi:hypothetical protein